MEATLLLSLSMQRDLQVLGEDRAKKKNRKGKKHHVVLITTLLSLSGPKRTLVISSYRHRSIRPSSSTFASGYCV